MTFRMFAAALVLTLALSPLPAQEADPAAVKKQLLDAWSGADQMIRTVRLRRTTDFYQGRGGTPPEWTKAWTSRYTLAGDRLVSDHTPSEMKDGTRADGPRELELTNDDYKAELLDRGKGLAVTRYKEGKAGPGDVRAIRLPWLLCYNVLLTDWLADPRVTITRTESLADPTPARLRVYFVYNEAGGPPGSKPVDETFRSGYLDFDPANHYCLLGYRMARKTKFSEWVETGTNEYGPGGPLPDLRKVTIDSPEIKSEKLGTRSSREVNTYEVKYNEDIPAETFWLSHYGLPEPPGVRPPRSTPRYVWFLAGAGAFAVLAVGFRYLALRRSAARPQPTPPVQP